MMTDDELTEFLGIKGKKGCAEIMARMTPVRREMYETMAQVEPKPENVIVCRAHKHA